MNDSLSRLPREPADRLTKPFMRFLRIEATAGIILLLSTLLALGLANTAWSSSFLAFWEMPAGVRLGDIGIYRSLKHWINDGLMTFFFVIALELKRELVLGELRNPRMAALPVAAALGGDGCTGRNRFAACRRRARCERLGHRYVHGHGVRHRMLALLGSRVPGSLRLFLLSLAIFDDIGAILIVAVGYGEPLNWVALGTGGLGFAFVAGIALLGIRSIAVYFVMGSAIWLAFDASGVHATLVGVILGLMTPARRWVSEIRLHAILDRVIAHPPGDHRSRDTAARSDLHRAGVATREAVSPIERLEIALHPWVAFAIMPLFAVSNAGVPIEDANDRNCRRLRGRQAGWHCALQFPRRETSPRVSSGTAILEPVGGPQSADRDRLHHGSVHCRACFRARALIPVKLGVLGASVISAALGFMALTLLTSPPNRR